MNLDNAIPTHAAWKVQFRLAKAKAKAKAEVRLSPLTDASKAMSVALLHLRKETGL